MSTLDKRIEPALHALLSGDAERLAAALDSDRGLEAVSWNGNTLLEWATQPPHGVDPACITVLIDAGSPLDRALGLAACWDLADMCGQLLDAGADPTSFESDESPITPLESAAMHGSSRAADVLVAAGLHRPTLWLAAACDQLELVTDWVSINGELLKPAGDYRPLWAHVGRPTGPTMTDDPDEVLGEALVVAAANGRSRVVDYLLGVGVSIDSAPYLGTTGLHFAVQFAKHDMVAHLLDHGASRAVVDDTWGGTPGQWAATFDDGSSSRQSIVSLLA